MNRRVRVVLLACLFWLAWGVVTSFLEVVLR